MQVFAVFDIGDIQAVQTKAKQHFGENVYASSDRALFVATSGKTTMEVGETLGFGEDQMGVVVPVTTYWGRHDTSLWEWIAARMRADG